MNYRCVKFKTVVFRHFSGTFVNLKFSSFPRGFDIAFSHFKTRVYRCGRVSF